MQLQAAGADLAVVALPARADHDGITVTELWDDAADWQRFFDAT